MDDVTKTRSKILEDYGIVELCMAPDDALRIASDLIFMAMQCAESGQLIALSLGITDDGYKSAIYRNSRIRKVWGIVELGKVHPRRVDLDFDVEEYQEKVLTLKEKMRKVK